MDNAIQFPHMMPTKKAAQTFGISCAYLRRLCKSGRVRYVAIAPNRWLVNCDSLAAYFTEDDNAPAEQSEAVAGIRRVTP